MKGPPILLALLAAACAGGEPRVELDVGALDLALRMLEEAEGVSLLKSLKSTPTPR